MEVSTFAWKIFGLLGMPRGPVFAREMNQVGSILLPVLLQWLAEQFQAGLKIPRFEHCTCASLMPRIYDAAVDGVNDRHIQVALPHQPHVKSWSRGSLRKTKFFFILGETFTVFLGNKRE